MDAKGAKTEEKNEVYMKRKVGVTSRGLISPIISQGDDIVAIATEILLETAKAEGFKLKEGDILGITESVVARAQGNYAHLKTISKDIREKFGDERLGIVFPLLSRNRFAPCLDGIAMGGHEIILLLSYPFDEVGNQLASEEALEEKSCNPLIDVFEMADFRIRFGTYKHKFTGIDYLEYYDSILKKYNSSSKIILANNPVAILDYADNVLVASIHTRLKVKSKLLAKGAKKVAGLDEILTSSIDGDGFNPEYGLLGSNKADSERLKLFPRDCKDVVEKVQEAILKATGVKIEVLIYGDGAFKDPIAHIWELADPVVSPAFTSGLQGLPNEVKLKYLADNEFKDASPREREEKIAAYIAHHKQAGISNLGCMASEGTTPRNLTDLVGSLCDLTSGSGDKGTPFVYIQNYFEKWTS